MKNDSNKRTNEHNDTDGEHAHSNVEHPFALHLVVLCRGVADGEGLSPVRGELRQHAGSWKEWIN